MGDVTGLVAPPGGSGGGGGGGGSGTVTQVSQTVPSWLTVGGSPITTSGSLDITATTGQTANRFLATPNGSTGAVALRAIVAADLPTVSLSTGVSGTLQAAQEPAHTGDVTNSAGSLATTIANNAVTNAKAAQMAANTIKGNNTGSTANSLDLTATQVNTLLGTTPVAIDSLADGAGNVILTDIFPFEHDPSGTQTTEKLTLNALLRLFVPAAFKPANTTRTSTTSLTSDPDLSITLAIGKYNVLAYLPFYEGTLGTGGFQFDLNGGTSTVGTTNYSVSGYTTTVFSAGSVTALNTATQSGTILTSSSTPSWFYIDGFIDVTVAGTVAIRWSQQTSSANGTILMQGAFLYANKLN